MAINVRYSALVSSKISDSDISGPEINAKPEFIKMEELLAELSEEEMERIDRLLIDRIDEFEDTEGKDEGVLDLSELDGLFTAIISGPVMIPPSQWLPVIWGDFEPDWRDEQEFGDLIQLLIRHMNSIAAILIEQPNDYEPLFLERVVENETYTIVDEWCMGYMRGVSLIEGSWDEGGREIQNLLMPIKLFSSEQGWRTLDKLSDTEIKNFQEAIPANVRQIHAFWLERREDLAPEIIPVQRTKAHVGRNDPCPCGSGKKYKKCCLH